MFHFLSQSPGAQEDPAWKEGKSCPGNGESKEYSRVNCAGMCVAQCVGSSRGAWNSLGLEGPLGEVLSQL